MSQVGNGQLANVIRIARQANAPLHNTRVPIGPPDIGQGDAPPLVPRHRKHFIDELCRAAPQGDESNAQLIEPGQIRIGGEPGVKHQLARSLPGVLPPVRSYKDIILRESLGSQAILLTIFGK